MMASRKMKTVPSHLKWLLASNNASYRFYAGNRTNGLDSPCNCFRVRDNRWCEKVGAPPASGY
jgi:hypothetical protein